MPRSGAQVRPSGRTQGIADFIEFYGDIVEHNSRGGDDDDTDQAEHQAVFERRGAGFVVEEPF
jgi:hypothetical protein